MSDRLDIVVIDEHDVPTIYHHPWGATALVAMLLAGPDDACTQARDAGELATELTDVLATCVIDRNRKALIIGGDIDVIAAAGPAHPPADELLRELSAAWGGWHLQYEPSVELAPAVDYLRRHGHAIKSMNDPDVLADELVIARYVAAEFTHDARESTAARVTAVSLDVTSKLANCDLSFRAEQELGAAGLLTVADVVLLDAKALAARGVSERVRRELAELLDSLRTQ